MSILKIPQANSKAASKVRTSINSTPWWSPPRRTCAISRVSTLRSGKARHATRFVVVPLGGDPVAVIPEIGAPEMALTWMRDIRTWPAPVPEDDGISLLKSTIKSFSRKHGRVGAEMGREMSLRMPVSGLLNSVVRALVGEGVSIKEIVCRTGHSRKLVRVIVRDQRTDISRVRQTLPRTAFALAGSAMGHRIAKRR